ncbi:hypothetical protein [Paenibacillus herberti]|uniref:Uncharacterized protein n=1 Tax=Paenibacillus herberti TaxID=1619309 RepID=A0A229P130_9BACL|nr:hypothetical protein [Paenibacillus herberti]OXM15943.1 hypothetical protein CGZ75_04340 [Paenibacillus herberti]
MKDRLNKSGISNRNGKSIGVILVLFILLVIVTRVFNPTRNRNENRTRNGSSSATEEFRRFDIINNTIGYTAVLIGLEGDAGQPTLIFIPPGGRTSFELLNIPFNLTTATVKYDILNEEGVSVGELNATLYNSSVYIPGYINITTTGPITTRTNYGPSPDFIPQLTIIDV